MSDHLKKASHSSDETTAQHDDNSGRMKAVYRRLMGDVFMMQKIREEFEEDERQRELDNAQ